jgi:beta-ribofuranosylaminobenzene 5'-phosphate synthase
MRITVNVPSRIHITLIDLGDRGYRRNGGVGFSIDGYDHCFEYVPHSAVDLSSLGDLDFSQSEIDRATNRCNFAINQYSLPRAVRLTASSGPSTHIGLGTGTAATLASLEALFAINERSVSPIELITLSGRGGTSGVGVNTYFDGGFVFDIGRTYDRAPFASSDDIKTVSETPLCLISLAMPTWSIGLIWPTGALKVAPKTERALFASLPLSEHEVFEACYHSVFGSTAAVASANYQAFCRSVNAIQTCTWKRREIDAHGGVVASTIDELMRLGCDAVGMSSVGPLVYFFFHDMSRIQESVLKRFPDSQLAFLSTGSQGRRLHFA